MKLYAGIDLHSNNNYIGILDEQQKRLFGKKLPNDFEVIKRVFDIYKQDLVGVVVESTYNWYWLVDGLKEEGYKVYLANPAATKQYSGLKFTDDKWDSFWLAHLLSLNILRTGYIYPKEERPVRDLLRRRTLFVQQRTSQILSLESMISRHKGIRITCWDALKLKKENIETLFDSPDLVLMASSNIVAIQCMTRIINKIEKEVKSKVKKRNEYKDLQTVPGIGEILALTITLETGEINRFPKVGNYTSYCRCVASKRMSNDKKKGVGNRKNGNRYLSWAYIEAANFARRYSIKANKYYQRKFSKSNKILATKALASKISKACYYIMRDQVPFQEDKIFT